MDFLKIHAKKCNVQGIVDRQTPVSSLLLNKDLVGAIDQSGNVLLKGGGLLNVGGAHYTELKVVGIQEIVSKYFV